MALQPISLHTYPINQPSEGLSPGPGFELSLKIRRQASDRPFVLELSVRGWVPEGVGQLLQ